jgi:uncharacterized protein DUF3307
MPTVETAAVAAIAYAALFAGHHLGDHPLQTRTAAAGKPAPGYAELAGGAHPWRGWAWCAQHVTVYTAVQAACLALVSLVAPLSLTGAIGALTVSAVTHAVIDRRWVVRWFLDAKRAHDWAEGPYLVDQSLHLAMLLVAAVVAAAVVTVVALLCVLAAGAALLVAALAIERHRVRLATPVPMALGAARRDR